jgi:hypothetical protein
LSLRCSTRSYGTLKASADAALVLVEKLPARIAVAPVVPGVARARVALLDPLGKTGPALRVQLYDQFK